MYTCRRSTLVAYASRTRYTSFQFIIDIGFYATGSTDSKFAFFCFQLFCFDWTWAVKKTSCIISSASILFWTIFRAVINMVWWFRLYTSICACAWLCLHNSNSSSTFLSFNFNWRAFLYIRWVFLKMLHFCVKLIFKWVGTTLELTRIIRISARNSCFSSGWIPV